MWFYCGSFLFCVFCINLGSLDVSVICLRTRKLLFLLFRRVIHELLAFVFDFLLFSPMICISNRKVELCGQKFLRANASLQVQWP